MTCSRNETETGLCYSVKVKDNVYQMENYVGVEKKGR